MLVRMKLVHVIENACYFAAVALCFWVDWRLGLALLLYEKNMCLTVLRKTDWKEFDK